MNQTFDFCKLKFKADDGETSKCIHKHPFNYIKEFDFSVNTFTLCSKSMIYTYNLELPKYFYMI